jgi:hypothetical protein
MKADNRTPIDEFRVGRLRKREHIPKDRGAGSQNATVYPELGISGLDDNVSIFKPQFLDAVGLCRFGVDVHGSGTVSKSFQTPTNTYVMGPCATTFCARATMTVMSPSRTLQQYLADSALAEILERAVPILGTSSL